MLSKSFFKSMFFKSLLFIFSITIVCVIYALLIYYNIINNYYNEIGFILSILIFIFLGFICGITSKKYCLIEAFISSLVVIVISLLLNYIFKFDLQRYDIIKITIFVASSLFGCIISLKPKKKLNK